MLEELGRMDIYLVDQVMKNRIHQSMRILDAGCGTGKNAQYFVHNNFDLWGIDRNPEAIAYLQNQILTWNPKYDSSRFQVADLATIPFPDQYFDFIISSAVLHFSESRAHFLQLLDEHLRVLRPNGIFWFRMTTKHTLESHIQQVEEDTYILGDGSTRYLLDVKVLSDWMTQQSLQFLDPFKTVNVSNLRTMSVVVLRKP